MNTQNLFLFVNHTLEVYLKRLLVMLKLLKMLTLMEKLELLLISLEIVVLHKVIHDINRNWENDRAVVLSRDAI